MSPAGRPLTIVVVGLGPRGRKHLAVAKACPAVEVVGVCDSDATRLVAIPGGTLAATDPCHLIDATQPDAAILALPHSAHYEVVREYAARGVAVLKEKPLARSSIEGWELASVLQASPVAFALGAQRRHSTVFRALAERCSALGPPRAFEYVYVLGLPPESSGWRMARDQAGGGATLDMGYHVFDLLTALLGTPDSVHAVPSSAGGTSTNDVEDGAAVLLRFGHGTFGTVLLGRHLIPESERFTFWWEKETLHFDGRQLVALDAYDSRAVLASRESTEVLLHNQLHAFVQLIREGSSSSSSCSLEDAMSSTATIEACQTALRAHLNRLQEATQCT